MRKRAKKLALSRETLRHLEAPHLYEIRGAESGTCPTDCDSAADCQTQGGACTYGCSGGCPGSNTCTCPPTSFIEGSCQNC
jgi:hypothetical protein